VTVRLARPDEAELLARIQQQAWDRAERDLSVRGEHHDLRELTEELEADLTGRASPEVRLWVFDEPPVLGYVRTIPSPDDDADASGVSQVSAIFVAPERWGSRVGQALMAHALDDLRSRQYREATLWVIEGNDRARRFYEHGGWQLDPGVQRVLHGDPHVRYRISLR
jgi:GNAT superfamily N-acetyltransferase